MPLPKKSLKFLMIAIPFIPTVDAFWGSSKEEPKEIKKGLSNVCFRIPKKYLKIIIFFGNDCITKLIERIITMLGQSCLILIFQ